MALELQSDPNLSTNDKKNALPIDILVLLFKYLAVIILAVALTAYSADNIIYAILAGVLTAFLLISALRDTTNIYYYIKARKFVNGVYLHGATPQCPFLKVDNSGFKCTIEFQRPFDMIDDFPRCHIEKRFREHWLEKNAGILDQARKETSPLKLRQFIEAIAMIKQPESADFLLEIITAPNWSSMQDLFVKYLPSTVPIAEKKFHDLIINQFASTNIGKKKELNIPLMMNNNVNQNDITKESFENDSQNAVVEDGMTKIESLYQQVLNQFLSNNMISLSPDQMLTIHFLHEFNAKSLILKGRNNIIVRQYALQALGILKDPRAIPHLLDLLGTDKRMEKAVVRILASMGDKAIESLESLIVDPNANQEKRYSAIEVLGMMHKKELYDFLLQTYLASQNDELAKSYLLSALGESDPERGLEIAIKSYYDKNEQDLVQDAAKKTLLENISSCLPILFQKLEELPEGTLTDEQEYIRVNTVIIIEDMDIQKLKNWMSEQGPAERSKFINIMNREGLEIVARRVKV